MAGNQPDRDETDAERIDRNWSELLQELRVTQTGLQILAGFLLTLPFQSAFERLSSQQRSWYLGTVATALTATVLVVAPVVAHRVVFRHHVKERLLQASDAAAKVGLVLLALTLIGALSLVTDVIFGRAAAAWLGGAAVVVLVALWGVLPVLILRGGPESYDAPGASPGS